MKRQSRQWSRISLPLDKPLATDHTPQPWLTALADILAPA
jgi:hypothetical protein